MAVVEPPSLEGLKSCVDALGDMIWWDFAVLWGNVGLDDLRDLLQLQQFQDSMIPWLCPL